MPLRGALRSLLRETPLSPGKVRFAWTAVVGPALERVTAVRLEGDTLLVEADERAVGARGLALDAGHPPTAQELLGDDVVRGD